MLQKKKHYPDAQNRISREVYTTAEVKDYDYWRENKYQVLERFYKVKIIIINILQKGFNDRNHLRKQTNGSYKATKYRKN